MSLKGRNGVEAGRENAKRFLAYIEERQASGSLPLTADGKLIRAVMERELGIARDSFRTNPVIRDRIAEIEGGVVQRAGEDKVDARASGSRSFRDVKDAEELKRLRAKVAQLEEENRYLKAEMRRLGYADLQLPDAGRLPW